MRLLAQAIGHHVVRAEGDCNSVNHVCGIGRWINPNIKRGSLCRIVQKPAG